MRAENSVLGERYQVLGDRCQENRDIGRSLLPITSHLSPERFGQSAIELVVAMIGTFTFLAGVLGVWSWLVSVLVQQQRNYDCTRIEAARPEGFAQQDGPDIGKQYCGATATPAPGWLPPPPKPLNVWEK